MATLHEYRSCGHPLASRVVHVVALATLFEASALAVARAQPASTAMRGGAICLECRLAVSDVVVLGDTNGGLGELHGNLRTVLADSRGHYFISTFFGDPLVAEYDRNGTFIRRLGHVGGGPGEYRAAWGVAVDGDSLFVLDPANARLTVQSLKMDREIRAVVVPWLARASSVARLKDGSLMGNVVIETEEDAGFPLHHFAANGEKLRSFGSDAPSLRPDLKLATARILAPGRERGVWVGHVSAYELERYSDTGELLQRLTREVGWFPPGLGKVQIPQPDGDPPTPRLLSLQEDGMGRLWTLTLVADANWRKAFSAERLPPRRPSGRAYYDIEDPNRLYDTFVEVLNPVNGSVLGSTRVDPALVGFVAPGLVWSDLGQRQSGGFVQVKVWSLQLREH